MPSYQRFPISDLKTGLFTATEPWKAPRDAFPTLYDARVDRGVLSKRSGYEEMADTGAGYPIMGIYPYVSKGHPVYLVADRKRLYEYRPYAATLTDLAGSNTFTGSERHFFDFQEWGDTCYVNNGKDTPYTYNQVTGTLAALNTVSDSDTDIQIDAAQWIFLYKSRLLFAGVTIDGTYYPRRLYYTDVNTTDVQSTNYVDADAADLFASAQYVNGVPTFFGHEGNIVRVKYTFDSDTPFAMETVEVGPGALGPHRAVQYKRAVIYVGHDGLVVWDGYQSRLISSSIRDFVGDMETVAAGYMQATMRRDRAILYLAYPETDSSSNNRILEWNADANTFAVHRISATALLATSGAQVVEDTLLDAESGYQNLSDMNPIRHPDDGAYVLFGGSTGKIYQMNTGTTDDGTDISASIYSAGLNPFIEQGKKAYFGRCDVLVSTSSTRSCTVSFYKDLSSTAYKQTTLQADGEGDKHIVHLFPDGEVGNFHRIGFSGDIPTIHAIYCDFAPAGKLDPGGSDGVSTIDTTGGYPSRIWRFIENDDGELVTQKKVSGTWQNVVVDDY